MSDERMRFIEREAPAQTPEEARQRRARAMLTFGAIALIWGLLGLGSGNPIAFVLALLGIALLVGGLIVRP